MQENAQDQIASLFSDFNTRLRDIEERSRLIRERVLVLGKNLISSKQDIDTEISEIKKENIEIKQELESISKIVNLLSSEFSKFVKKDEIFLIEKMLKDFQPLEFMRKKDVEELLEKKIKSH